MKPGWYELRGEEQVGKTTLAIMIAKEYGSVLWLSAPQEDPAILLAVLDWEPTLTRVVSRVDVLFAAARAAQEHVDLIVIDSLAGMAPSHPDANNIAPDVRRSWFEPSIPILVINQDRHPAPPGGAFWRGVVNTRSLLQFRRRPALYSRLWPDEKKRWLVWWQEPVLRVAEEDDLLWIGDEDGKEPFGVGPRVGPWLI